MSFVGVPDFAQVNTAEAIFDQIGISHLLSKEQLRNVEKALAMIDENGFGLESFLHGTSQAFPQLAADPTAPANGDVWINTTTAQAKIRLNGATKVFTLV
jgi:hypothetical protein